MIPDHSHEKHQLLYAIEGVMVVYSALNQWTVPPNRGIWMPAGHVHSLRCVGTLKMRSVFVRPDRFVAALAIPQTLSQKLEQLAHVMALTGDVSGVSIEKVA